MQEFRAMETDHDIHATKTDRRVLIIGLRKAHAVENQAQGLMERQLGCLDDDPGLEQRLWHPGSTNT